MVQTLLEAAQVSTEPLEGRLRTPADRQGVPWSGNGLRRGLDVEPGAGEAVREDLVDHGCQMPRRAAGIVSDQEVVRVRYVVRAHAEAVPFTQA